MLTQVLEQIRCAIHTSGKTSSMTLTIKQLCYTLKSTDYRKITFVFWLPGTSQAHSFNEFDWDQNEKHCWPDATDLDGVCWADIHVTPLTPAVHHTCSSSTHTDTHTSKAMVCANLRAKCGVTPCRKPVRLTVKKCESLCVCVHVHKAEEMSNIVHCEVCLLCNNTQADQLLLSPTRLTHCERDKHTHMQ